MAKKRPAVVPILKPGRKRPRDAKVIRAAVFDAARTVFRRRGVSATPAEIASYAGVGVGTLYRHFGDKDSLLRLVVEERQAEIMERARTAVQADDPWGGLKSFLWYCATLEVEDKVMAEILTTPHVRRIYFAEFSKELHAMLAPLIQRAQDAGQLRSGITSRHAILSVALASKVVHFDIDDVNPNLWRELVEIAVDGLQGNGPRHSTPVPEIRVS